MCRCIFDYDKPLRVDKINQHVCTFMYVAHSVDDGIE